MSRWGRFLDSDEAAHYEYLCKRAGISVHYCAEQFENDNSTISNLLKALKRTIAGEYSRELSVKISAGQRRLVSMGFWQGGTPPFGMMRQIVGQNGKPKCLPGFGEWKSVSTDRVVLIPGPPEAIRAVRLAYDLYTEQGKDRHEIAQVLNARRVFRGPTPWTVQKLRSLFLDPTYKGAYVYGKHDFKFHKWKAVPSDQWLIREHSFPGIISEKQWNQARDRIGLELKPLVDTELLEGLRRLWKRKGRLNSILINAARDIPSVQAYHSHFGGINEAYRLIGYPLPRDYSYVEAIRLSRRLRREVCNGICEQIRAVGGTAERMHVPGVLLIKPGQLTRVPTLLQRVVNPAVLEINGLADFGVAVEPIRKGGQQRGLVTGFRVAWWRKDVPELKEAFNELKQPKVGRMARLKAKARKPLASLADNL